MPMPEYHAHISHLSVLRLLLDRMQGREEVVCVTGCRREGLLALDFSLSGPIRSCALRLGRLRAPEQLPNTTTESVTVAVRARDLTRALHCHILFPDTVIAGLSQDAALVLYVSWPPAVLTYFIPARTSN